MDLKHCYDRLLVIYIYIYTHTEIPKNMNMIFKTLLRDFFQFLIQIYSLRSHKFLTLLAQIQQLTMVFVAHHMEVFSRDLCIDNHANIAIQIGGGGGDRAMMLFGFASFYLSNKITCYMYIQGPSYIGAN